MFAARYLGPYRVEPGEIGTPAPQAEEALVQVEACGMCGSDLGIFAGLHPRARAPLTLGHEFVAASWTCDRTPMNLRWENASLPTL